VLCRTGAIFIHWSESSHGLQEKLAESALGVMTAVGRRMVFFNFLTYVEKDCDCMGEAQKKAIDDIGILASTDPVAIDQASADLLNTRSGQDFFRSLFPSIDWTDQLSHGEKIGLGSRSYELAEVL
jgi:hypothetical protein